VTMHHDKQGKQQSDPREMNQQRNPMGSERNEEETGKPLELNKDKDKENMGGQQRQAGQPGQQQGGQHQGGQQGGQGGGQHQGGQGGQQHAGQRNP
jgi:translation initiation factor IF-2